MSTFASSSKPVAFMASRAIAQRYPPLVLQQQQQGRVDLRILLFNQWHQYSVGGETNSHTNKANTDVTSYYQVDFLGEECLGPWKTILHDLHEWNM